MCKLHEFLRIPTNICPNFVFFNSMFTAGLCIYVPPVNFKAHKNFFIVFLWPYSPHWCFSDIQRSGLPKVPEHAGVSWVVKHRFCAICTSVILLCKGEVTVRRSYKRILCEHWIFSPEKVQKMLKEYWEMVCFMLCILHWFFLRYVT